MKPNSSTRILPWDTLLLGALLLVIASGCGSKDVASEKSLSAAHVALLKEVDSREGRLYLRDTEQPFSGMLRELYNDGQIKAEAMVVDGLLHGPTKGFYLDRQVQVEESFEHGLSHGVRRRFREDGTKLSMEAVHQGQLHGRYEKYHADGSLSEQADYLNGQPHGVARAWDTTGNLTAEVTFDEGEVVRQNFIPETSSIRVPVRRDISP